jgi:primosomal protein N' (replication factor Y)
VQTAEVVIDRVARGLDRPLSYAWPEDGRPVPLGARVRVPLGSTDAVGVVVAVDQAAEQAVALRPITTVLDREPVLPEDLIALAFWMRDRWCCLLTQALRALIPAPVRRMQAPELPGLYALGEGPPRGARRQALFERVRVEPGVGAYQARADAGAGAATLRELEAAGHLRRGELALPALPPPAIALTAAQQSAVATILSGPPGGEWLLEGVTGSGKTEVYLELIAATLRQGRQAIVLLPEISLTEEMRARYQARFPGRVAIFHSAMAESARLEEWYRVRRGAAGVVLGPRSAVFAPCPDLGLIVMDEEHEPSYKQEEHPRYHARETARERCRLSGARFVMGSATPSLETAHRARTGVVGLVALPHRVTRQSLPDPLIVDMRQELADGHREMFSRPLKRAIGETLYRGEQAVLFLNRRGYATSVVCRDCGLAIKCPDCAVSLTFHRREGALICHYCFHQERMPKVCPACASERIRTFGVGTEQVEEEVHRHWPGARTLRADADTLRFRGSHRTLFDQFRARGADVLVGTQMVAKGMDWPGVTLVGIVAADITLTLPDFRAGERAFQLVTQAAGRAGRGDEPGRVVIQTYNPEHYAIAAAAGQDFPHFYALEIPFRQALSYPPFGSLLLIEAAAEEEGEARRLAERGACEAAAPDATILGPAPAPLERIRGRFRYHVLVKAPTLPAILQIAARVAAAVPRLSLTIDPQSML